jgi:hypothetical protein
MVIHNQTSQSTYTDRDIPYFPLARIQLQFEGGKKRVEYMYHNTSTLVSALILCFCEI